MIDKWSSFNMKKSQSLIERKHYSIPHQKQLTLQQNPEQSHVQELIKLKYDFTFRVKATNHYNKLTKKLSLRNDLLNTQNSQKQSQFLNKTVKINDSPLFLQQQNQHKIKFRLEINPIQLKDIQLESHTKKLKIEHNVKQKNQDHQKFIQHYTFIKTPQKRNLNEYKSCIKNIEMNTTYRGFNTKKTFTKNFINAQKLQNFPNIEVKQKSNQSLLNDRQRSQRKRIISYLIERGFAKKMEESLIRTRKERKLIYNNETSLSKIKIPVVVCPIIRKKSRKSIVVNSQSQKVVNAGLQIKRTQRAQQSIDPW